MMQNKKFEKLDELMKLKIEDEALERTGLDREELHFNLRIFGYDPDVLMAHSYRGRFK